MRKFKSLCLPNELAAINQRTADSHTERAPRVARENKRCLDLSDPEAQDKATLEQVVLDFCVRHRRGDVEELSGYFNYINNRSTGDARVYHQCLRDRDKLEDAMGAPDHEMIKD